MGSPSSTESLVLPAGYAERAAQRQDAAAVAALRTACHADEGDTSIVTAEEQVNDWEGTDLSDETVVVTTPEGSIVAAADVVNRANVLVSVYGAVHPAHRGRGLGTYLARWGEAWTSERMDRAPADAQVAVQHYINSNNTFARALMDALGYAPVRTVYVMEIALDAVPPEPRVLQGIRVRSFVPGQDERAVFEAVEDAFKDLRDRPPGDFERFLEITESARRDPGLWFLAEDAATGELAGVCLTRIAPGTGGWIGPVGVRRPWRKRGLGLALLHATFAELHRRGIPAASLSVDADSPTGAPRLYIRAGMHPIQSIILFRKKLRAGKDYSTLAADVSGANG